MKKQVIFPILTKYFLRRKFLVWKTIALGLHVYLAKDLVVEVKITFFDTFFLIIISYSNLKISQKKFNLRIERVPS